jgi:hypothetical protein
MSFSGSVLCIYIYTVLAKKHAGKKNVRAKKARFLRVLPKILQRNLFLLLTYFAGI